MISTKLSLRTLGNYQKQQQWGQEKRFTEAGTHTTERSDPLPIDMGQVLETSRTLKAYGLFIVFKCLIQLEAKKKKKSA